MKQRIVILTQPEIDHTYNLMHINYQDGEPYYGNAAQYWARHHRVMAKLDEASDDGARP